MLTKLINNDLKKVTGGVLPRKVDGFETTLYYVPGTSGENIVPFYNNLRSAVDKEWDLYGEKCKDKKYSPFNMNIPDKETLYVAYDLMLNRREFEFEDYVVID